MKRAGHLIERMVDLDQLLLAFYKAQKGKQTKPDVLAYKANLQENLLALRASILSGEVQVGDYHYFTVYDPKKRQICAAPFEQRVLHHALMNVCHEHFERIQTPDSYASRKGKGTYAALQRASHNHQRHAWFLKLDIRKFFDSVHHGVLRKQLSRMFKDGRLLRIFDQIIDSYEVSPGRGVPIGNLTSQYFANHYLAAADHYVKEKLQIPAYIRYMDDMVLWHQDKSKLLEAGRQFRTFIENELLMELKPDCLNHQSMGLPFLGYLLYPDQIRLAKRSRLRYTRKYRTYALNLQKGVWNQKQFERHSLPMTAFTEYANATGSDAEER